MQNLMYEVKFFKSWRHRLLDIGGVVLKLPAPSRGNIENYAVVFGAVVLREIPRKVNNQQPGQG